MLHVGSQNYGTVLELDPSLKLKHPETSRGYDFHPADFHPADFHPADIHPADFHPADFHQADFILFFDNDLSFHNKISNYITISVKNVLYKYSV